MRRTSRLRAGCDTFSSRDAPLIDPAIMTARNTSICLELRRRRGGVGMVLDYDRQEGIE
ncbi:hypothetical protein HMPREF9946_04096 [Acetobacteraceae bacterium AT-5844]|nr:hypothetical protein HMPREF9946_04096 [Acetobacteraceae bacterium AT-5844]